MAKSQKSIKFSVPVHWDLALLEKVNELKVKAEEKRDERINVVMYGSLPDETFGSGRISSSLQSASALDAKRYIQQTHDFGFGFRYLFNPKNILTRPNRARVLAALQNVIEDFEVSDLTIAQKEVLDLIQKHYPAASVTISTIAGVKTREQIREYSHYSVVRRICAHHDLNRNTILLRRCVDESGEYGIDLELMLTENCVNQCPIRDIHYAVLGRNANKGEKIDEYQIPCWLDKLRSPEEIIGASWITPKGISFYESLGIHEFKITGRDKDKKRLPLVVEAYFNRSFDGNLMRLLGTAPQSVTKMAVEAENLVFLDTEAMDGFYEKLDRALANGISYEEFCRKITVSLFREGSLVLLDSDSRYEAADGKVICQRCGQFYRNTLEYVQDKRVYELWKNIRNQKG